MASPSTTRLPGFLQTRFGRRLFGVFVLGALLPIGSLATLAFVQVTDELNQQTEGRLRSASRAAGMRVFDRLNALEVELAAIGASWEERAEGRWLEPGRRGRLAGRFRALWLVGPGAVHELLGSSLEPPDIDLPEGASRLVLERHGDGFEIFLARRLDRAAGSSIVAIGEIAPDHLFDISHENALPPLAEFALLDGEDRILASSWEGSPEGLPIDPPLLSAAGSSLVEWRVGGTLFLARSWSLFLEASYRHPPWTVVVAEPKEVALAPIARFRTSFPLVIGGAIALIGLLTTGQIRRRLVPLETLREGTERIARREFDVRLSVSSGDELEDVAGSFNQMAEQLSDHFESLTRLAEIDREIVAATEEARVVETLILRAAEIYPCDAVALRIEAAHGGASPRLLCLAEGAVSEAPAAPLLEAEESELRRNPLRLDVEIGPGAPSYLSSLAGRDLARAVVLPLLSGPALLGLIAFLHRPEERAREDRILYARQLADQFASALSDLRAQRENYALTHFDPLTGLPNRALFEEHVREAVVQARRREEILLVVVLDLDGFKRFNSAVGSGEGDRLLLEVATRLSSWKSAAAVGRLGGDEFGVLVRSVRAEDDALPLVAAAVAAASEPIRLVNGEDFHPGFCAGGALFPSHGEDAEPLLLRAMAALDEAKESSVDSCRIYAPTLADRARNRLSLESQLRRAIAGDQLRIHYQPVVHLGREEIVGAEALLRWQHPQRGLVPPEEFVALAEETGLIVPIGEFVLREACLEARRWKQEGLGELRVNVNLSGRQLREANLLATVKRALLETSTMPTSIGLELTESMLVNADTSTVKTLNALTDLGVRLYIDDFGTGYSCLGYLSQLPIDALKVDQSFVRGIPENPASVAISRTVIALADGLDLGLVAEGVETAEQLEFLRQHGCMLVQGFWFSEALAAEDFQTFLREWPKRPASS